MAGFFEPDWPLPKGVRACITTRQGGVSEPPYVSNNLAAHVGDRAETVAANRHQLINSLGVEPKWLNQTHSTCVWRVDHESAPSQADASITTNPGVACCVLTADCLPLLICNHAATEVAAVHAGWRGLASGVISKTLRSLSSPPAELSVYLGPAISQQHFEVGGDVLQAFQHAAVRRSFAEPVELSFVTTGQSGKYHADLFRLARAELNGLGVSTIYGGEECSYALADKYYSYRRDGVTGRMASLIWITSPRQ